MQSRFASPLICVVSNRLGRGSYVLGSKTYRKEIRMSVLIGVLITFLVVVLVLYLINMLPIEGRAKQIVQIIVIRTGRSRMLAASSIAWRTPMPRSRN